MVANNRSATQSNQQEKIEEFYQKSIKILEMMAIGTPTNQIYEAIALLFESRHKGLRCSMLELKGDTLIHGGAPSLPESYCEAVNGLKNGENVGSCGTSTFTGKRCVVEDIETDPKWKDLKQFALPHGLRCCWSEPIIDSSGKVMGAFGMYFNEPRKPNAMESQDLIAAARLAALVMERDHNQKRIRDLAYYDELTNLANRVYLNQYVDTLTQRCIKKNCSFYVLYIDLDNFKQVNDTLGHEAGDELLKIISNKLLENFGENFISRLCGDEFCVIYENSRRLDDVKHLALRCCECISKACVIEKVEHNPTCSVGISKFPDHGSELSELLKAADTALYASKELGKNCYAFYEPELTKKIESKITFQNSLKDSIKNQALFLEYQPMINIANNFACAIEALARWHHPKFGKVSPNEFVPIIENIGLMTEFTQWVLIEACQQAMNWDNLNDLFDITVNISPNLMAQLKIVNLVQNAISETGISPTKLIIEVSDTMLHADLQNLTILKKLKDIGVRLAIDDFGVGYSSLASLKHLQVDMLKIDKSFVSDMLNDKHSKYLVSSMIDIGHHLGYQVVAEGVESQAHYKHLQALNCDIAQGFYICKPCSALTLISWYEKFKHQDL